METTEKIRTNGRDEKGRFSSGNSGRPPRSANKLQQSIRDKLGEFLEGKLDDIEGIYSKLPDREKGKFVLECVSYFMPKQREVYVQEEHSDRRSYLEKWPDEDIDALLKLHSKHETPDN